MSYRWAVQATLAVLLSAALTAAARAQSENAAPAADGEPPQSDASSPADRFAVVAAAAQLDLPPATKRPRKRSVLEPSTSRWLEDDATDKPAPGASPQTLMPDSLGQASRGPAPAEMPDDLPLPRGHGPMNDDGGMAPNLGQHFFDRLPRMGQNRQPMLRESWLFRPFNISFFEGALFATAPIPQFANGVGFLTGFRVGWDFDPHFGGETRFGFSKIYMVGPAQSVGDGYEKIFYFDANLLIYPWGDTRWRPFFTIGGGLADVLVVSNAGTLHPGAFNLPFGGGIKYRLGSRVAFRADLRDNLTMSGVGGMRTLNNIELLGSIEFHFGGGDRRSYWPWNPSRHWW
jgi:hypothetical protein